MDLTWEQVTRRLGQKKKLGLMELYKPLSYDRKKITQSTLQKQVQE